LASTRNYELFKIKAELCKTFSDPKRLIIIDELRSGEKSVSDLVRIVEAPQAVVSRHLAILRDRGVVTSRRDGTNIFYNLADPKIGDACDLVHQVLINRMEKSKELADELIP